MLREKLFLLLKKNTVASGRQAKQNYSNCSAVLITAFSSSYQVKQLTNRKKMRTEKIKLTDSTTDVVTKMSEGNIGAMNVIMKILVNETIDPDNIMGGIAVILSLDSYGIYGTAIYVLHNDICDCDLAKTLAVLRATQMGMLDHNVLKAACYRQYYSGKNLIPVEELYAKVKQRLPAFNSLNTNKSES